MSSLGNNSPPERPETVYRPSYVQACEDGRWHLDLTHHETEERKAVPYRCNSWRHGGACAKARASDDARRIREGFVRYEKPMAYLVLTFNPTDFDGGTSEAYREIVRSWQKLYQRLSRRWGKAPYVMLVEEHRNEWPHLNVLLGGHVGAEVAAGRWRAIRRELAPMVTAAGFGIRLWVDARAGTAALPQYIAKYCTKAEQAPVHAPRHFRRLRATRGFLGAPKPRGLDYTGGLVTTSDAEREKMEAQRDRARYRWRDVEEMQSVRAKLLEAIARGEASGAELGITRDPATWPEEWTAPLQPAVVQRCADSVRELVDVRGREVCVDVETRASGPRSRHTGDQGVTGVAATPASPLVRAARRVVPRPRRRRRRRNTEGCYL